MSDVQIERAARRREGRWPTRAATMRDLVDLQNACAEAMAVFVRERLEPMKRRVEALEAGPSVVWCDSFKDGNTYVEANLTTHAGGLWLATTTTRAKPGSSPDWRLIVKSGTAVPDDATRRYPTQRRR